VQSAALAPICPAVAVECGRAGDAAGVARAAELIGSALTMERLPDHPIPEGDLDLMQTFAIIKIPPDASFSYNGSDADFRLRPDLDHLNFCELDRGTFLGTLGRGASRRLDVLAVDGGATEARCLEYVGGEIRLSRRAIPAMLTLDATAVRLDCVGYLMHRIGRDGRRVAD